MQTPRSAAAQFRAWGASVTAIGKGSKQPLHKWKCYYETPQSDQDARRFPWRDAVGVGLLNGQGDWRTFDVDKCPGEATVDTLIAALGLPPDYRWVYRSGSGKGWEVAFICHDELPANVLTIKEKGVFWGQPKDGESFDHIELRWDRCQTIAPPSQYAGDGPGYRWRGEAPDAPPATVSIGHVLAAFFAVAILKIATDPKMGSDPKPKHDEGRMMRPTSDREAIDEIKRRFDLLAYARKHWPGDIQKDRNGEIRIKGHGGLLISEEKGTWNSFRDDVGGDAIELIGYHLYGDRWDHDDGTMFRAALEEGARETGVDLPPPGRSWSDQGAAFSIDESTPEGAAREIERLRARVAQLEEWREWAMKVASIETKKLSPAAKVVAFTLWPEMQSRKERGVDEPQRVYIEEASKRAGVSTGTYGAKLKELHTVGALARLPKRQPNGHKKILLQPVAFDQPEAWAPPAPRDHGGYHPKAERPAPACPDPECTPETPFDEEVSTISRLVCKKHGEFHITPERLTHRTWKIDPKTDLWKPTKFHPRESPNTQLAGYREDSSTPITQVECRPNDAPESANTQIAGWVTPDPDSEPRPVPAAPVKTILPDWYKSRAAQLAKVLPT